MRRMGPIAGATFALMLLAIPALAQGGGTVAPRQGHGMMRGGPGAMERNPAAVILEHRAALELTDEQASRIEAIRARIAEENGPRWEQLRAAFGDVDPRELSAEERQAHRERMRELAPLRDEIRATNRAAGAEIHEILTDDQEAKLRPIMHEGRRGRMQPRGGRGPRGPRGGGI